MPTTSRFLVLLISLLYASSEVQAHFPWLNTTTDGKAVYFFGESLAEKTYKLPPTIAEAKVFTIDASGKHLPLPTTKVTSDDFLGLVSNNPVPADTNLASTVTYGLFGTSRLDYYTLYLGAPLPKERKDSVLKKLKWDLQAGLTDTDTGIELQVQWKGKPVSDTEVHLYGADGEENGTAKLDSNGIVTFTDKQVVAGINGIMFGHRVPDDSGSVNGKEYQSTAHYFTLTFQDPEHQKTAKQTRTLLKPLPTTLTSFGAATVNDYLYVFSGHQGSQHGFSKEGVSDNFRRIRFDDPSAEWEELAMHERAQSTALITDGTYLYRVAGLTFDNTSEEDTIFRSTTHFARYDIQENKWTDLAPLPSPRSSLDAAILGRSIYVAGGWNLEGASSEDAEWKEDILRFNLDKPEKGWQTLPGPGYNTRAASVAVYQNKLFLFGGIQTSNITRKVSIFDPSNETWSEGPELPSDSSAAGFATSSFATGGSLYVTGDSGIVYKLNETFDGWEQTGRLMYPRMFLRLVPADSQRLLAIGGTSRSGGRMASIEAFDVNKPAVAPSEIRWSNKIDEQINGGQTFVLSGSRLYTFGGQSQGESQTSSSDKAFVFNLQQQSVESLPNLPEPTQGAAGVVFSQTSEHRQILLFGGQQTEQGKASTGLAFNPDSKEWTTLETQAPQFKHDLHIIAKQDALWFFGAHQKNDQNTVLHWWGDDSAIAPIPGSTPPNSAAYLAGVAGKDTYYRLGGLGETQPTANTFAIFNFDNRSWKTASPPAVIYKQADLAIANNKVYLLGIPTTSKTSKPTLQVYDVNTNAWTDFPYMLPKLSPGSRMFSFNDRLLFYSVNNNEQGVVDFVMLDPEPMAAPGTVAAMSFTSSNSSKNEVQSNVKLLMRRDADRDGKLTSEELGSRLASIINEGDSDKDGAVSFAELQTVMEARLASESE